MKITLVGMGSGLPGSLTLSVLPRSTLTPRLSIPRGVMLRLW